MTEQTKPPLTSVIHVLTISCSQSVSVVDEKHTYTQMKTAIVRVCVRSRSTQYSPAK